MENVMIVSQYSPHFGGNFIESIKVLDEIVRKKGGRTCFLFPEMAKNREWIKQFANVCFTDWSQKSINIVFAKCLKLYKIQIIHYHFISPEEAIKCSWALRGRAKEVYHIHNHIEVKRDWKTPLRIVENYIAYAGGWKIGVSEGVSESIRQIFHKNVCTIRNGVLFERIDSINDQVEIADDSDMIKLLMFGNHYQRKGVDYAAKAIENLNASGRRARLYIVADNPKENYTYIEQFVKDKKYRDYIKVIPTRNDIGSYYSRIDIFLSPSREEGFPYAIIEAMYAGCQCVLTEISGQDECRIPKMSWISNPQKVSFEAECRELELAICRAYDVMNATNYQNTIGERREYIKENFNINIWADAVLDVYSRALE